MRHNKPYIILVQHETRQWTIRAQYETLQIAQEHSLDILETEYPSKLKIVKDLPLTLIAFSKDKIEYKFTEWCLKHELLVVFCTPLVGTVLYVLICIALGDICV